MALQAEVTRELSGSPRLMLAFPECHGTLTGHLATPHDNAGRRWLILHISPQSWERPDAGRRGADADCGSVSGFLVENESAKVNGDLLFRTLHAE